MLFSVKGSQITLAYSRIGRTKVFQADTRHFFKSMQRHGVTSTLCFKPPVVYSTDPSKAVVSVLVLLIVALWFILRGDLFYVLPCVILYLCFSVLLALRLPRLEKRANLSAFRTFVRFALVWFCLFPLPLGVLEELRFVFVALPGLFSCLLLYRRWRCIDIEVTLYRRLCAR